MVPGSKRRKVEDIKPFNYEDIALKLLDVESERDRALIALLYLSGRRINELLLLRKKDFRIEEKRISFETFNEKAFRKSFQPPFTFEREIDRKKAVRDLDTKEILYPRRYEFYSDIVFNEMIRPHWRTDSRSGKALTEFILKRLESLSENDYLFQKQGKEPNPISRFMAYRIIRFYFPDLWLHIFRHERFTEIFKVYRDDIMTAHRQTFHRRMESDIPYLREIEKEEEKI